MNEPMRVLVTLALTCMLAVGSVVQAEQTPEATAKAAAEAFVNAAIAKDLDAVVQIADFPFAITYPMPQGSVILEMLGNREELVDYLFPPWRKDQRHEEQREKAPVPDRRVVSVAEVTKSLPKSSDDLAKHVIEAAGADGFVVFIGERNEAGLGILIRIRGDSVKVVGLVHLILLEPHSPDKATPLKP